MGDFEDAGPPWDATPASWADLPPDLLRRIFLSAHALLCSSAASVEGGLEDGWPRRLPPLDRVARLMCATEGACRSWREVARPLPLRLALGRSRMPHESALLAFLCRHELAALHIQTSTLPGCGPGVMQSVAISLLEAERLAQAAGDSLAELAVCDYVCSRPLCALLPRYPALRTVALSGYSIDVDLAPLNELPELEAFSLDTDQLPPLGGLPPQLRRLSLSCIANTARVSVPQQLRRLESLACHCPHQRVFLGLGRALEQCRSIRATGSAVHLLLQVDDPALLAAEPAAALVAAFQQHTRAQRLLLEAPEGQLALRVCARGGEPRDAGRAQQRGRPLDPHAVCAWAAASGLGASMSRRRTSHVHTTEVLCLLLTKAPAHGGGA